MITEEEGGGFGSVPLDESKSASPLAEGKACDDLPIFRDYMPTESIAPIYLDLPVNSDRNYKVLLGEESGRTCSGSVRRLHDRK